MPLDYGQVYDRWNRSQAFGDPRSMTKYAQDMNTLSGTQDFSAGLSGSGAWTQTSHFLDDVLQKGTPVPGMFGAMGGLVGGLIGNEQAGEQAGRSLPRALLNSLPAYLAGPEAGIPATLAAMGGTGLLMGANTYADTGSAKAAAISGVTGALLPKIGEFAGGVAARIAGAPRVVGTSLAGDTVNTLVPETFAQRVAQFAGSQTAQIATNQVSMFATDRTLGQNYNVGDPQFWLQQIPFTVMDIAHAATAPRVTAEQVRSGLKPEAVATPETPYVPPSGDEVKKAQVGQTMQNLVQAIQSGAPSEAVSEIMKGFEDVTQAPPEPITPLTPEVPISLQGTARQASNGKWKMHVEDQDSQSLLDLPEHKNVWINSTTAPVQRDGSWFWNGKKSELSTNVTTPIVPEDKALLSQQPELPTVERQGKTFVPRMGASDEGQVEQGEGDVFGGTTLPKEVPEGFVRAYHGGVGPIDSDRDITPTFDFAKGYAVKSGGDVWAVDIPKNAPWLRKPYDDSGEGVPEAPIAHQTAPQEVMQKATKIWDNPDKGVATATIAPDEARHMVEQMGVSPKDVARVVQEPEVAPEVKAAVTVHEEAQATEAAARQATLEPFDAATKIVSLVSPQQVAAVREALNSGASATQALEKGRLLSQTPTVDESQTTQQVAKEDVKELTKAQAEEAATSGPNKVIKDLKGQPSLPWSAKLKGSPYFESKSQALEFLADYKRKNPGDKTPWDVQNRGEKTAPKQYAISWQKGKTVSLDAPIGEAGTAHDIVAEQEKEQEDLESQTQKEHETFGERVAQVTPQMQEEELEHDFVQQNEVHERPAASVEAAVESLKVAGQQPRAFATATGLDLPDSLRLIRQGKVVLPVIAKEGLDLGKVNSALPEDLKFTNAAELKFALQRLGKGIYEYRKMSNFTLDSLPPHDLELFKQMGWEKGPRAVLDWFTAQPNDGITDGVKVLARSLLKALPKESDPVLSYPGHPEWQGDRGWYYTKDEEVRPRINTGALPTRPEHMVPTALATLHEMVHHGTRELAEQNTPAALKFKTDLEQIRLAAVKSLPKDVQRIIQKSIDSGNFFKYSGGQLLGPIERKQSTELATYKIARDYLASAEYHLGSLKTALGSDWKPYSKLTGNELYYVRQHLENIIESGALEDKTHPYHEQAKALSTQAGKERVVSDLATVAKQLLSRFPEKYPKLYRDIFKQEPPKPGPSDRLSYQELKDTWVKFGGKHGTKLVNSNEGIIYALHNVDELMAQAFSDPSVLLHLTSTQMPEKVSLLDRFSSAIHKLFGEQLKPNSALTHLLSSYDNYLGSQQAYNGRHFLRDMLVQKLGVRPDALASRLSTIEKVFNTGKLNASLEGFTAEQQRGLLPVSIEGSDSSIHPAVEADLTTGRPSDVTASTMSLLAKELPLHQEVLARTAQDVYTAQELVKEIKAGRVPGSIPTGVEEGLRQAAANVNAMRVGMRKQVVALERFTQLNAFTQDGFDNMVIEQLSGTTKWRAPVDPTGMEEEALEKAGAIPPKGRNRAELEGKGIPFLWRNLAMTQFLQQQFPILRPVIQDAYREQANMSVRNYEGLLAAGTNSKTGEYDSKLTKNYIKVRDTDNLNKNASEILRYIQVKEAAGEKWDYKDPYVRDFLGRSGSPDSVQEAINSIQKKHANWVQKEVPEFMAQEQNHLTSFAVLSREAGMKPQQARDVATKLYTALAALKDPQGMATGVSMLQGLQGQMQPDTFMKALTFSQGLVAANEKHLTFLNSRPTYVTEQRFGDHQVVMVKPDGKPYRNSFDTKEKALADVKSKEAQGYRYLDYVPKSDANVQGGGIADGMLRSMQERDAQVSELVKQFAGADPDLVAKILPLTQRAAEYQASLATFSPVPGAGSPKRRFVGGREDINMLDNADLFYARSTNYMRHRLLRASSDVNMLDPELQQNRQALQLAQQHIQNQLSTDNPLVRKLNEMCYFKNLAFNFGVNFLHGVQSLTTGMASVIAETGGVGDAFALTAKAQKAVLQRVTTGKWDTPEHEWVAGRLKAEGNSGIITHDDISDPDKDAMFLGSRPKSMAGKAIGTISHAARSWTDIFARNNDMIGTIAGFDLAKERGMNNDDAYAFGLDMKRKGYYSGGKPQRSIGSWSPETKAVPQLMHSLQGYTLGWFGQLANNWRNGFGSAPKDLTPTQRLGAKKAFLYQMGAQAVMAGAFGLPGVGQGTALLKQVTGIDTKDWMKKNLENLFGEDEGTGGFLTTTALHGLLASATPIDASGRHIPTFPFLGISPKTGFSLDNLIPAPLTSASDVVKGLIAAAHGDMGKATLALPHVLQGPMQLWQGSGKIKDQYGTYALSPAEQAIRALGMTSSRISEEQDTAKMIADNEHAEAQRKQQLASDIAERVRSGDVAGAQQKLQEIRQADPTTDIGGLARQVASRVAVQRDPNVGYDLSSNRVAPFMAQRQSREQTMAALGIPSLPNMNADIRAQQSDALMTANPYWSPAEVRMHAQGMLPTPNRSGGLWPTAFQGLSQ